MKITPQLIRKYHHGDCTPEEKAFVKAWLEEVAWPEKFDESAVGEESLPTQWLPSTRVWRLRYLQMAGVAASILVLIAVGLGVFKQNKDKPETVAQLLEYKILTTKNGQTLKYSFEDGTIVYLNSGSTIRVPSRFSDTLRRIELEGEAYFTVAKDASRPFIVITPKSATMVLGTEFNLKAYADEDAEIVVSEGKVTFGKTTADFGSVILTANDRAILDSRGKIVTDKVNAPNYSAWKDRRLVINDLPLSSIIPIIERHYNVKVAVRSVALLGKHYNGSHDDPSLEGLIDDMAFVMNFKYKLKDNVLTISQ